MEMERGSVEIEVAGFIFSSHFTQDFFSCNVSSNTT